VTQPEPCLTVVDEDELERALAIVAARHAHKARRLRAEQQPAEPVEEMVS